MWILWRRMVLVGLLSCCCGHGADIRVEALSWLVGEWRHKRSNSVVTEVWEMVGNKVLLGTRVVKSKGNLQRKLRDSFMISEMGGDVFYFAKGRPHLVPIPFLMVHADNKSVRFENRADDFPKVIEYTLTATGQLDTRVSDGQGKGTYTLFDKAFASKEPAHGD